MNMAINDDVCEAGSEVIISTWLVDDGDAVEEGMVLCELMAGKVQIEFTSPASGTIKLLAEIEQPLTVGDVIATVI